MFIRAKRRTIAPQRYELKPQRVVDFVLVESIRTDAGPRQKVIKHLGTYRTCEHFDGEVVRLYHSICQQLIKSGQPISSSLLAPVKRVVAVPNLVKIRRDQDDARATLPEPLRGFIDRDNKRRRESEARRASKKRRGKLRYARRLGKLAAYHKGLVKRAPLAVIAKHAGMSAPEPAADLSAAYHKWIDREFRYEAAQKLGCMCDWMAREWLKRDAAQRRFAKPAQSPHGDGVD